MSIIKLKHPWCVNTGGMSHTDVENLQKIFVDKDNESYPWLPNMYVGINSFGESYCEFDAGYFDDYGLVDNVRVYSKKEILEIAKPHLN